MNVAGMQQAGMRRKNAVYGIDAGGCLPIGCKAAKLQIRCRVFGLCLAVEALVGAGARWLMRHRRGLLAGGQAEGGRREGGARWLLLIKARPGRAYEFSERGVEGGDASGPVQGEDPAGVGGGQARKGGLRQRRSAAVVIRSPTTGSEMRRIETPLDAEPGSSIEGLGLVRLSLRFRKVPPLPNCPQTMTERLEAWPRFSL